MKNVLSILVVMLFASPIMAQSNKEDIAIIQEIFGKEKKELVILYMAIPEDKKTAFWAMYDQYEDARKALGRQRIALIEAYAESYETLDNKKSDSLMNRRMKWTADYAAMQKKYYTNISKIIGARSASKFIQLEDYLENNIRLAIQESIPFIDELDKSKVKQTTQQ
jgi:hypothetical protein